MATRDDDWTDRYDSVAEVNASFTVRFALIVVFWATIVGHWRGYVPGPDGIWFGMFVLLTALTTVGTPLEYLYLRRVVRAE